MECCFINCNQPATWTIGEPGNIETNCCSDHVEDLKSDKTEWESKYVD
jgi:hypothetical protein